MQFLSRPVQQIQELRRMREAMKNSQDAASDRGTILPRGTVVLAMILLGLFCVPWVLRKATEFNVSRLSKSATKTIDHPSHASLVRRDAGKGAGEPTVETVYEGKFTIDWSPDEDLEQRDVAMIGRAQQSVDAALYSATDRAFCDALAAASKRGVKIRVYRDREQDSDELKRARGHQTCTAELIAAGISVKVKASSELMHLKSYEVDGKVLRTGSANLSESGEVRQDNDVVFIGSVGAAAGFERNFERMWNRVDNDAYRTE